MRLYERFREADSLAQVIIVAGGLGLATALAISFLLIASVQGVRLDFGPLVEFVWMILVAGALAALIISGAISYLKQRKSVAYLLQESTILKTNLASSQAYARSLLDMMVTAGEQVGLARSTPAQQVPGILAQQLNHATGLVAMWQGEHRELLARYDGLEQRTVRAERERNRYLGALERAGENDKRQDQFINALCEYAANAAAWQIEPLDLAEWLGAIRKGRPADEGGSGRVHYLPEHWRTVIVGRARADGLVIGRMPETIPTPIAIASCVALGLWPANQPEQGPGLVELELAPSPAPV